VGLPAGRQGEPHGASGLQTASTVAGGPVVCGHTVAGWRCLSAFGGCFYEGGLGPRSIGAQSATCLASWVLLSRGAFIRNIAASIPVLAPCWHLPSRLLAGFYCPVRHLCGERARFPCGLIHPGPRMGRPAGCSSGDTDKTRFLRSQRSRGQSNASPGIGPVQSNRAPFSPICAWDCEVGSLAEIERLTRVIERAGPPAVTAAEPVGSPGATARLRLEPNWTRI